MIEEEEWSPAQIAGVLRKEGIHIAKQTIYNQVHADTTGKLALHMPHGLKYKKRGKILCPTKATNNPNRTSIHERPKEGRRNPIRRLGNGHHHRLLRSCHRHPNRTFDQFHTHEKLPQGRKALPTARAVIRLLFPYRQTIHTITTDNGCEFAAHQEITKQLSLKGRPPVKVYFTDAYSACRKEPLRMQTSLFGNISQKRPTFRISPTGKSKRYKRN